MFDFGLTPRYVKELVRDDDEVRDARPADLFNIQPQNNKISVRISRNQRKY